MSCRILEPVTRSRITPDVAVVEKDRFTSYATRRKTDRV